MDLRTYMKSLNKMGMISLMFESHFRDLGYDQNSKHSFNLRNNLTLELFPNSQEPHITLTDHSTNLVTTFLFDPSIAFAESHVIVMQRMYENVSHEIYEELTFYKLLDLIDKKKQEIELE
jgi:hypothetical protein